MGAKTIEDGEAQVMMMTIIAERKGRLLSAPGVFLLAESSVDLVY